MIAHPFAWVKDSARVRTFWTFAALAVLTMIALQAVGAPLKTAASPAGIVSFELAGSLANSERMLAAWDPLTRVYAGVDLGLDYLFIVTYVAAIGLGCTLVAERLSARAPVFAAIGVTLAWAMLVAGVLDSVENYALLRLLFGAQENALAMVARYCAIPKFAIVAMGLLYVIVGAMRLPLRTATAART